jgi:hypothetical protein
MDYEIDECSHHIPEIDVRAYETVKRQKENGYEPFKLSDKGFPTTREERAKRFFANGKYASGKYKIWLELGGYVERIS